MLVSIHIYIYTISSRLLNDPVLFVHIFLETFAKYHNLIYIFLKRLHNVTYFMPVYRNSYFKGFYSEAQEKYNTLRYSEF